MLLETSHSGNLIILDNLGACVSNANNYQSENFIIPKLSFVMMGVKIVLGFS